MPVGHVEEGGDGVTADRRHVERVPEHGGVDGYAQQDDEERRKQPTGPLGPEPAEAKGAGGGQLATEEGGDQEAGQDEEDIDAE